MSLCLRVCEYWYPSPFFTLHFITQTHTHIYTHWKTLAAIYLTLRFHSHRNVTMSNGRPSRFCTCAQTWERCCSYRLHCRSLKSTPLHIPGGAAEGQKATDVLAWIHSSCFFGGAQWNTFGRWDHIYLLFLGCSFIFRNKNLSVC